MKIYLFSLATIFLFGCVSKTTSPTESVASEDASAMTRKPSKTDYLPDGSKVLCTDRNGEKYVVKVLSNEEHKGTLKVGGEKEKRVDYTESQSYVSFTVTDRNDKETELLTIKKYILFYQGESQTGDYSHKANRWYRQINCALAK